jgi:hypothetical protein
LLAGAMAMQDGRVKAATACMLLCFCGCSGGQNSKHCASLQVHPAEFVTEGQPLNLLADGDDVALIHPPQNGRVILIGAQVENLTTDTVDIQTTLRDPVSGTVYVDTGRTIAMVPVDGQPGLMQPDLRSRTQVSHMTMCPVHGDRDVVDQSWSLEVSITEWDTACARTGSATLHVVPRCVDTDPTELANCRCLCQTGGSLTSCATP